MANLEGVVDTGILEEIHTTVVSALEQDLYRPTVGRFRLQQAQGEFNVGNYTDGRRILLVPSTIKRYELHFQPRRHEETPGAVAHLKDVGIIYSQEINDHKIERNFEVSFSYPCYFEVSFSYPYRKSVEEIGSLELFGFELISRVMRYNKATRGGQCTHETLRWIYDQLRDARTKSTDMVGHR